jgi:type II secretion system protein G
MTSLRWIDPETSIHLTLSLFHFLWQGAVIIAGTRFLLNCLRNRSAQSRYWTAMGALCLMAACVPANYWLLGDRVAETDHVPSHPLSEPAGDAVLATFAPSGTGIDESHSASGRQLADPPTVNTAPIAPQSVVFNWKRWAPQITLAYAVGVTAMLLRLAAALYGGHRLRGTAQPIGNPSVVQTMEKCVAKLGMRVVPVIASCSRTTTPLVVGILKPAILLPIAVLGQFTPQQIEAILLHELAHIRRYDHLTNLLQRLIEMLLFFHPAVWWLSRNVSVERENCCDDMAIAWGSERCNYAEALVRVSEIRLGAERRSAHGAAVLAATGNGPTRLYRRVLRVLGTPLPGPNPGFTRHSLAIALVCVVAAAPIVVSHAQVDRAGSPSQTAARANSEQPESRDTLNQDQRRRKDAKAQVLALESAIKIFRKIGAVYPATLQDLVSTPADPARAKNWAGPYISGDAVPMDPWGNKYQFVTPGKRSGDYDVWSTGPDGKDGTADDIGNWPGATGELGTAPSAERDALSRDQQRLKVAESQIELLGYAIKTHRTAELRYPTSLQDLVSPPADPARAKNWAGPYISGGTVPRDPWGNAYQYATPGKRSGDFDIWSAGTDGQDGTADDIGNWSAPARR